MSIFPGNHPLPRLLLLSLCMAPLSLPAIVVEGLYETARPVADQGEEAQRRALQEGLAEVLTRVTGDEETAAREALREAFADPMTLVQRYRYARDSTQQETTGLRLHMAFDPAALEALLRRHEQPIWGRERPETLVWLVVDDGRRRLISGEDGGRYRRVLRQAAQRRGAPVLFPLLDLEERQTVTAVDLWGGFDDAALAVSERYGAAVTLIIRLQRKGATWRARWTQYAFDASRSWETAGALEYALNAGMDDLADALARRFVVAGGPPEAVRLQVAAVKDLAGYGRLMGYLQGLSPVTDLQVLRATGTELTLLARVRGGAAALAPIIELERVLYPSQTRFPPRDVPPAPIGGVAPPLHETSISQDRDNASTRRADAPEDPRLTAENRSATGLEPAAGEADAALRYRLAAW